MPQLRVPDQEGRVTHGDELTLFNPEDGEDEVFIDEFNEVKDLRRGRKKKAVEEDEPSEEPSVLAGLEAKTGDSFGPLALRSRKIYSGNGTGTEPPPCFPSLRRSAGVLSRFRVGVATPHLAA